MVDASGSGIRWSETSEIISENVKSSLPKYIRLVFLLYSWSILLAWVWHRTGELPYLAFLCLEASSILGSFTSSWRFFICLLFFFHPHHFGRRDRNLCQWSILFFWFSHQCLRFQSHPSPSPTFRVLVGSSKLFCQNLGFTYSKYISSKKYVYLEFMKIHLEAQRIKHIN